MDPELISKIVPTKVLKYSKKNRSFDGSDNLNYGPWDIGFSKITARPLVNGTWDLENWIEIARNPVGDFLFMKAGCPKVFVYYHEEKITDIMCESFEQLVSEPDNSPSKIPPITYTGGQQVLLGDVVQVKGLFRTRKGVVKYVPGISPKDRELEYNRMAWVKIVFDNGSDFGAAVVPHEMNTIAKKITLVSRADGVARMITPVYRSRALS
jgi:hypothetical protein